MPNLHEYKCNNDIEFEEYEIKIERRCGKYAANFLLNHYQLIALCRLQCEKANAHTTQKDSAQVDFNLAKLFFCLKLSREKEVNERNITSNNETEALF